MCLSFSSFVGCAAAGITVDSPIILWCQQPVSCTNVPARRSAKVVNVNNVTAPYSVSLHVLPCANFRARRQRVGDTRQTLRVRTLVSSGCDIIHTAPTVDTGLGMNQQRVEYLPAGSEGKATDLSFFSSAAERQFFTVFSSWSSHLSVPHWGTLQWMMKRAAIPLAWLTATAKGKVKKLVQLICFIFYFIN